MGKSASTFVGTMTPVKPLALDQVVATTSPRGQMLSPNQKSSRKAAAKGVGSVKDIRASIASIAGVS